MELTCGFGRAADLIAQSGVLKCPFVLVDVGARGGIDARWAPFEPAMRVFGFDAETLVNAPNDRQKYFEMAIGDLDGECFISTPDNRFESRIADSGRPVPIRKLDTLSASSAIPPADFIKIDVEGYEPQVLAGAREYLKASTLLGADVETTFNSSPMVPDSHLAAVMAPLFEHGLRIADFAFDRPGLQQKLLWPGTCNALFVRDITRANQIEPDTVLKTIAVLDVYGLPALALAVLDAHHTVLQQRINVKALAQLLVPTLNDQLEIQPNDRLEIQLPYLGLGIWSTTRRLLAKARPIRRSR